MKINWNVIASIKLALIGITCLAVGLLYNLTYMEVGVYIANSLNLGVDIETYKGFIIAFSEGGKIKPMPTSVALSLTIAGVFIIYIASLFWVNREDKNALRYVLKRSYWTEAFLLKRDDSYSLSEETLKELARSKELKKRLEAK